MMHMAFMKPDEYSVSHLKCVYVYVYDCFFFSFSRESPSEKIRVACGKTNQRKWNGTGRNGRARRFAMVFFFSHSLYPSLSFSLYLVFLHVKRREPNNEIACVSFSFPGSGFACFDGIFWVVCRGTFSTATAGFLFTTTNKLLGDGVERVFV